MFPVFNTFSKFISKFLEARKYPFIKKIEKSFLISYADHSIKLLLKPVSVKLIRAMWLQGHPFLRQHEYLGKTIYIAYQVSTGVF